jgi:hypothetical protein
MLVSTVRRRGIAQSMMAMRVYYLLHAGVDSAAKQCRSQLDAHA